MKDGDDAVAQARKGRPSGKRGTFTFRVTADLRARLETEAVAAQRPVSEEIEKRLEQSFAGPEAVRLAADTAAKAILTSNFASREVFEAAQLYGRILRDLIDRLRVQAGDEQDWDELEDAKAYLKQELAARVDGMVEALFCDLDLKRLQGADAVEADALVSERRIPREIGATYLVLRGKKAQIRQQLLPQLMDKSTPEDKEK